MSVVPIERADDPRVADFLGLTDVSLRRRREPAEGLFIAEGELVIARAVAAGYVVRAALCEARFVESVTALIDATVDVYVGSAELLRTITGFHVHRGALASMARRPLSSVAEICAAARRLVVVEDMVSTTNLGAVFRCAAALGVEGVLLSPRCADPLYRRSVRVSMGHALTVPYARLTTWPDGLEEVRAAGFTLAALTPEPAAEDLATADLPDVPRLALVLGTEGAGLSAAGLAATDRSVRIPMAAGVDSLNVAAAAAVAFWAARPARSMARHGPRPTSGPASATDA